MSADSEFLAQLYNGLGQALLTPPAQDPDAEREYYRLFLSPEGAPCPPWQSVYLEAEGEKPRLMGPPHHSALDWYRRYGFEPAAENEPADHLGLLLLFYAHLLAAEEPESVLASFEDQHLAWAPRFIEKLHAHARHPRYLQLAADLAGSL
ncbi:MAG: molecular chaperone TorD family protein [Acidobacteria bacterium]|nr:molecular chaperone TorD family protein [Acidobacteriota bacterium]